MGGPELSDQSLSVLTVTAAVQVGDATTLGHVMLWEEGEGEGGTSEASAAFCTVQMVGPLDIDTLREREI